MTSIKTRIIRNSLERKGFKLKEKTKHTIFKFCIGNRETSVYTLLSRGRKEYSGDLLSNVKRQLKFESMEELIEFVECPISQQDYENLLIERNIIQL